MSKRPRRNYANAKSINERRQKLVQTNITSVETAQTAKAAEDAALGDLNLADSDVLVAEANISDAKAQQQQQSATLDFHTLTAPYDAMVTARLKELGLAQERRLVTDIPGPRLVRCSPAGSAASPKA